VLCDDLGYGDLGAFGATRVRTPNIDRLAREGTVLNDYYAAANLCTPSRAGFLTGRYPIRTGLGYEVILANDTRGLDPSEITIAEALKPDYASALIGKWHLGHVAPFWPPTRQGFDLFFGLPYSHDIQPLAPVHFMLVPKKHVATLYETTDADAAALGRILTLAGRLAREQGADDGFRTIINTGRVGRQDVRHVHVHVIGGPDPLGPMIARA
jgi:arylsulfatase A-like enzyme